MKQKFFSEAVKVLWGLDHFCVIVKVIHTGVGWVWFVRLLAAKCWIGSGFQIPKWKKLDSELDSSTRLWAGAWLNYLTLTICQSANLNIWNCKCLRPWSKHVKPCNKTCMQQQSGCGCGWVLQAPRCLLVLFPRKDFRFWLCDWTGKCISVQCQYQPTEINTGPQR